METIWVSVNRDFFISLSLKLIPFPLILNCLLFRDTYIPTGDELQVNSFSDFSSKKLAVTFTSLDSSIVKKDSIIVHFSSEVWVPNDTNSNNMYRIADAKNELVKEISIFPNPANNYVIVNLVHNVSEALVTVSDLSGRQVLNARLTELENKLDVSKLANGNYIIKIQQNSDTKVEKLTIIH